jgi:superfamily II DNA/RNA helicase
MLRSTLIFCGLALSQGFSTQPFSVRTLTHLLSSNGNFESLTVPELKDELRSRGLIVGGKKNELVERLEQHDDETQSGLEQQQPEEEEETVDEKAKEQSSSVISISDHTTFEDLGIIPQLLISIEAQQWEEPTPIQKLTIPEILQNFRVDSDTCKSLWAEAPTGSGKTGAFTIPLIQLTLENRKIERNQLMSSSYESEGGNDFQRNLGRSRRSSNGDNNPLARGFVSTLILSPTRELALQTGGVIEELIEAMPSTGKGKDNIDVVVITGGMPMEPQIEMLAERKLSNRNVDILVATPGRLADVLLRSMKEDSVEREMEKKLLLALDTMGGKNDVSLSLGQLDDLDINKSILNRDDGGRSAIKDMLSDAKYLVLDEADRLLSQGFKAEMDSVLELLPRANSRDKQSSLKTLLFSATFPEQIQPRVEKVLQRLSGKGSPPPLRLSCSAAGIEESEGTLSNRQQKRKSQTTQPLAVLEGPASTIDVRSIRIDEQDRTQALRRIVQDGSFDRVLVFVATRYASEHVALKLRRYGIKASELHGKLDQDARTRRLEDFKKGKINVLIATDLASRGLDVQGLPAVVNYDLPRSTEDFIHRIGRTGRAGQKGTAITFVTAGNEAHYGLIEKRHLGGKSEEREVLPGFEPNEARWEIKSAATTVNVDGVLHSDKGLAHDKMFGGIKGRRKTKKDKLREKAAREVSGKKSW